MNNENLDDYAINTVKGLRDSGDLIASFFLCSSFVEHYCKTKLFIDLTAIRPIELVKIVDKSTKKKKNAVIWSKMKEIIWNPNMSQSKIIDIGLLVGAWNKELYDQLRQFNRTRNHFTHQYDYLLKILEKDEQGVRDSIEQGLSLLNNIKLGFVKF